MTMQVPTSFKYSRECVREPSPKENRPSLALAKHLARLSLLAALAQFLPECRNTKDWDAGMVGAIDKVW